MSNNTPHTCDSQYERFDLDILITAYNVQATIKKTPLISGESDRMTVYEAIKLYVKQKSHFDETLVSAQRQKNFQQANAETKWYNREIVNEDIYKWKPI